MPPRAMIVLGGDHLGGYARHLTELSPYERMAEGMKAGVEADFEEFIGTFGRQFLHSFIRRGMSPFDAEDLALECVVAIATRIGSYKKRVEGFGAWAWRLAKNAFSDWHRKHYVTEPLDEDRPYSTVGEIPPASPNLMRAVDDAIAKLKPAEQRLIRMRYFGGDFTFDEIGRALGTTSGTTRVRHLRLLQKLAARLRRYPAVREFLSHRIPPTLPSYEKTHVKSKTSKSNPST